MPAPPDYNDVAARLAEFRERHPDGCLRPSDPARPYTIETIGDKTFVVVVAAAYRSPDDVLPGIGMAWEPFPGPTNFTRDSELQNAETSAWGRAMVAALRADTKRGVASADEVRNRQATPQAVPGDPHKDRIVKHLRERDIPLTAFGAYLAAEGFEMWDEVPDNQKSAMADGVTRGVLLDDIKRFVKEPA